MLQLYPPSFFSFLSTCAAALFFTSFFLIRAAIRGGRYLRSLSQGRETLMCVEHFFLFFFYSHVVCINAGGRLTLSAEDPRSQVFSHQRNRRKARQKRWRNAVHRMPEGKTHSPFYIFICNLPFSLSLSLFVYNIQPTLETWVVVVRKPSSPDER